MVEGIFFSRGIIAITKLQCGSISNAPTLTSVTLTSATSGAIIVKYQLHLAIVLHPTIKKILTSAPAPQSLDVCWGGAIPPATPAHGSLSELFVITGFLLFLFWLMSLLLFSSLLLLSSSITVVIVILTAVVFVSTCSNHPQGWRYRMCSGERRAAGYCNPANLQME